MYSSPYKGPYQSERPAQIKSKKLTHRQREVQREEDRSQKPPTAKLTTFPQPKKRQPIREWSNVKVSEHAKNTVNPVRKICDSLFVPPNKSKTPIRLNLGDPTIVGNLPPPEPVIVALKRVIDGHMNDGYGPSVGTITAREAVARHFSIPEAPFTADDVVLASGCSHALEMSIIALANPGDNILVPIPGFPLYTTLCKPNGIETKQYGLKMNDGGLVDLADMERQINAGTRAIVVNNPSNPTGVVLPKEHLEAILTIAYKHKVPIIADEIYGDLVYDGAIFHPMASLSPKVPILSCDGIAKRYLTPGWRLGWVIVHDRYDTLTEVKKGIVALSQKIVGPCSLIQGALPAILSDTPPSFFENVKSVISTNASIVYSILCQVPGLKPLRPHGAMYMMVGFDHEIYGDETPFIQGLITEESIYCLPGSVFSLPNWFRLVLTYPPEITREACGRIVEYTRRRLKPCSHLAVAYSRQEPIKRRVIDEGSEGEGGSSEESLSIAELDD